MKKKKSQNLEKKLSLSKKTISSLENLNSDAAGKIYGGTAGCTQSYFAGTCAVNSQCNCGTMYCTSLPFPQEV